MQKIPPTMRCRQCCGIPMWLKSSESCDDDNLLSFVITNFPPLPLPDSPHSPFTLPPKAPLDSSTFASSQQFSITVFNFSIPAPSLPPQNKKWSYLINTINDHRTAAALCIEAISNGCCAAVWANILWMIFKSDETRAQWPIVIENRAIIYFHFM